MNGPRLHPTALIEADVRIGDDSAIWDNVHVRSGATIGEQCIIGEKTYIAYDVTIGNLVKINANVYVCAGVTIEDGCMISAHVVFTNDITPRAANADLTELLTSEPTAETLATRVERGATVGANATIGPGLTIGTFAMVGMGAVVTRDVPPFTLVVGNPARVAGIVSRDGERIWKSPDGHLPIDAMQFKCENGDTIVIDGGAPRLLDS